jgi:formylglycine-generating enzyme required for sulfatase activity
LSGNYVRAVRGRQAGSDDATIPGGTGGYMDNDNGTVTDTYTSLMWQQDGPTTKKNWEQALAYCEGLTLGGYTDWRLPTPKELHSLVDYSHYNQGFPTINNDNFPSTVSYFY